MTVSNPSKHEFHVTTRHKLEENNHEFHIINFINVIKWSSVQPTHNKTHQLGTFNAEILIIKQCDILINQYWETKG